MNTPEDQERVIRLLETTHTFPGDFTVTVIATNQESVSAALVAAVCEGRDALLDDAAHVVNQSRGGRYLSHRFTVVCQEARDVLRLYDRVRSVEGVVTVL